MASGSQSPEQTIELQGEKQLYEELSKRDPMFDNAERFLRDFQTSCAHVTFNNLETEAGPTSPELENQIWDAHMRINSRFRKLCFQFREQQARKKRPVEDRKLKSKYQKFISGSQQFYEDYLKFILSRWSSVPELKDAATELSIEPVEVQIPPSVTSTLRDRIVNSCYSTLIRLGDLSRYYQMVLVSDISKREWSLVVNFYRLAGAVKPMCGRFQNQLALIALAGADHFHATYYFYRALCAMEPHADADGNLELEFKKFLTARSSGRLAQPNDERESLIHSFIYLHAMCYKNVDFSERSKLEDEVLDQMAMQLREGSMDVTFLQTLCLMNIGAEAHARTKSDTNGNAVEFFMRLNVKTFTILLQLLIQENNEQSNLDWSHWTILPALRNYSSWLVANRATLVSQTQYTTALVGYYIRRFWEIYASALNFVASNTSRGRVYLNYLLPEDCETLGFSPLMVGSKSRRHVDDSGNVKPKAPVGAGGDRTKVEAEFRTQEFLLDGLDFVRNKEIPIRMLDDRFVVDQADAVSQSSNGSPSASDLSTPSVDHQVVNQNQAHGDHWDNNESPAESRLAFDVEAMVDELVNCDTNHSAIEDETTESRYRQSLVIDTDGGSTFSASQEQDSRAESPEPKVTYSPGPLLPSIFNTAFAPQPGEVSSPSRSLTASYSSLPPHPGAESIHSPFISSYYPSSVFTRSHVASPGVFLGQTPPSGQAG
ncbi:predicted protein [Uncinocarpus reesii 1704]|uniref:DNA/RNA-binding domain-containing protein n=1 Tax=Uncinocarpus reesii (strain UAMH 1704) TaxID=336963 RepID=C4JND5_UNCRE|nr:uncharacterized protein UREG_04341 [Uncinocarpus reesii 1704]EEP79495.1 predicted protein [Uncinocarpus reesii 1704]